MADQPETENTTNVGKWLSAVGAEKYRKKFFDRGCKDEERHRDACGRQGLGGSACCLGGRGEC
jgi:hypothetical protein